MSGKDAASSQSKERLSLTTDGGGFARGCLNVMEGENLTDLGVEDALAVEGGDLFEQQQSCRDRSLSHPVSEPEAFDRPWPGNHEAGIDGDGFTGERTEEDEASVFAERSENLGGGLAADGVDGVLDALAAGLLA